MMLFMARFTQESLETLRTRIDLAEVVGQHVELKRAGAVHQGLGPFHDQKTPSFMIHKGDSHYHCFGCGEHGDAIQFLMEYLKMSFGDSVEHLAQRFGVTMDRIEGNQASKGPSKARLKEALGTANELFHTYLLHTEEGHQALRYLYARGIELEFIKRFGLGLAPRNGEGILKALYEKRYSKELLIEAGLAADRGGRIRSFFSDRITFPICDPMGNVIGFSARKYQEETFGGKYVNTSETPLFKKSRVLFGLHYCRRRITKEHKAIIVEGQIDALRLIYQGFNLTVAGQGTAFGEGHAKELLNLGVRQVYLALDGDEAGREAAVKIGNLFQRTGVEVFVVPVEPGKDPDALLMEEGPEAFQKRLENGVDYLTFLVSHHSRFLDQKSPAGKTELVRNLTQQIRHWEDPVMVHESLRKLAGLADVPESAIGIDDLRASNVYVQRSGSVQGSGSLSFDPNRILEADLLRLLMVAGKMEKQGEIDQIRDNVKPEAFHVPECRELFTVYLNALDQKAEKDALGLVAKMEHPQAEALMQEVLGRRVNRDKMEQYLPGTILNLLKRNWMSERETIQLDLQKAEKGKGEMDALLEKFTKISQHPPKLLDQESS